MTSMEPNSASLPAGASVGRVTIASVLALAVSVGGNLMQWQKGNAELAKTRAEVASLQQQQSEASTKSIQSWIEQLQKFDNAEDRVMVLSAAAATSPYDSVKSWAREQMLRLEGALDERKKAAEAQIALADAALPPAASATPAAPGHPAPGPPATAGSAVRPPPQAAIAQLEVKKTAAKNLERVAQAEALLAAAKMSPRPIAPVPEPSP